MNSYSKNKGNMNVAAWETPRLFDREGPAAGVSGKDVEARQGVYEEAFREGFDHGKELGLREAQEQLQLVKTLLTALRKPLDDQSQQLTETIVQLAGNIARAVVSRELKTDPEVLMAMVRQTLAALTNREQEVSIHLNPRNAQILRDLISNQDFKQSWQIVDDPHIALEDFKIRCQDSVIDTDLDTRINLIINQLLEQKPDGKDQ
ncbi:MAG: FliH/SctL family protein [Gammaproteobacteria bacterium]|jgi:flagellar assembly protein FliH